MTSSIFKMHSYTIYISGHGLEECAFWGPRAESNQQLINWIESENDIDIYIF